MLSFAIVDFFGVCRDDMLRPSNTPMGKQLVQRGVPTTRLDSRFFPDAILRKRCGLGWSQTHRRRTVCILRKNKRLGRVFSSTINIYVNKENSIKSRARWYSTLSFPDWFHVPGTSVLFVIQKMFYGRTKHQTTPVVSTVRSVIEVRNSLVLAWQIWERLVYCKQKFQLSAFIN